VSAVGDEGGSSSVNAAQKCTDDPTTVDVKCVSLVARDDSTTAPLTSGHVTANEHDHMVSSTIHSDGQLRRVSFRLCMILVISQSLLTPTTVYICLSVCPYVRTKTAETTITKLATGLIHLESWLPI